MKKTFYLFIAAFSIVCCANAQVNIQPATTLNIEGGTKIVLQGDLVSSALFWVTGVL